MKYSILFLFLASELFANVDGYSTRMILGYEVLINDDALENHTKNTLEAVYEITEQLRDINELGLKSEIVTKLKDVRIFLDWDKTTGDAEYHESEAWLLENGYIPEKAKNIEVSNIENFLFVSRSNQPFLLLHQMAHAYHDQVLTHDYIDILDTYNSIIERQLYGEVAYYPGSGAYIIKQAEATDNFKDYFAEISEAFLGYNDFYPFKRIELEEFDDNGFALCQKIWQFETTNINNEEATHLGVYPNPTNDKLFLDLQDLEALNSIEIYNISGEMVLSVINISNGMIDVSALASGVYYLKTSNSEGLHTKVFVKE